MPEFSITVNGNTYGLISRYSIPSWLMTEYCTMPVTLNVGSERLQFDAAKTCFLCDRPFEMAVRKSPLLCTNLDINHKLGRVGIICSECLYYLREREGYDSTPKSIKKVLDEGFYPVNIGNYIQI